MGTYTAILPTATPVADITSQLWLFPNEPRVSEPEIAAPQAAINQMEKHSPWNPFPFPAVDHISHCTDEKTEMGLEGGT